MMIGAKFPLCFFAAVVVFGLSSQPASAVNTYRAGDEVQGRTYNELFKSWSKRNLSILVAVSDEGKEYVFFVVNTGLGSTTVGFEYTPSVQKKLLSLVNKAIEWSKIARTNRADTTKGLGCFGRERLVTFDGCQKSGDAKEKNQVGLGFFSANNGQQTDLIVDLIDWNNQFIKAKVYLNEAGMRQLLTAINAIPDTMKKAKSMSKKRDLFK
jgi:hypothetical protein